MLSFFTIPACSPETKPKSTSQKPNPPPHNLSLTCLCEQLPTWILSPSHLNKEGRHILPLIALKLDNLNRSNNIKNIRETGQKLWRNITSPARIPGLVPGPVQQCHCSRTPSWGPSVSYCSWILSSTPEQLSGFSYHSAAVCECAHTLLCQHQNSQHLPRQKDLTNHMEQLFMILQIKMTRQENSHVVLHCFASKNWKN